MRMSSGRGGGRWPLGAEFPAIAQQGKEYVDEATGEC